MEEEKILENITKSVSDRLKIPIIVTYLSVMIIYNWDILYFIFFENTSASLKIRYIKNTYQDEYYCRIAICFLISIILIILFTILNTSLNYCLKWFYRKDKEIISEIEDFEQINLLTQQLSQSIDEIKALNSRNAELTNINQNLSTKSLNISISDISKADLERLLSFLNSLENKEKYVFSLKELINNLKSNIEVTTKELYSLATYETEMQELISILRERNLLQTKSQQNSSNPWATYFELSPSFKDFLQMEL